MLNKSQDTRYKLQTIIKSQESRVKSSNSHCEPFDKLRINSGVAISGRGLYLFMPMLSVHNAPFLDPPYQVRGKPSRGEETYLFRDLRPFQLLPIYHPEQSEWVSLSTKQVREILRRAAPQKVINDNSLDSPLEAGNDKERKKGDPSTPPDRHVTSR